MIDPATKVLASIVIVGFLVVQWCWDLPEDSVLRRLTHRMRRPTNRVGLAHTWKLFAPKPPAGTGVMRFVVTGRDGEEYEVTYPPSPWPSGWGRPHTRLHKVRQSLANKQNVRLRRSFSRWLVDEFLPAGPAAEATAAGVWTAAARVRCFSSRQMPPPLDDLDAEPPSTQEWKLFDLELPAPGDAAGPAEASSSPDDPTSVDDPTSSDDRA